MAGKVGMHHTVPTSVSTESWYGTPGPDLAHQGGDGGPVEMSDLVLVFWVDSSGSSRNSVKKQLIAQIRWMFP